MIVPGFAPFPHFLHLHCPLGQVQSPGPLQLQVALVDRSAFSRPVAPAVEPTSSAPNAIVRKVIRPIEVYPKDENKDPNAVWDASETSVTREGNTVTAKVIAVRSRFIPDRIDAKVGDELILHITNIEQTGDMIHGFAINDHDMNVVLDPGETKTIKIKLTKSGVYPFYCTNFCSALHQEMQGYLVVQPEGAQPLAKGN